MLPEERPVDALLEEAENLAQATAARKKRRRAKEKLSIWINTLKRKRI